MYKEPSMPVAFSWHLRFSARRLRRLCGRLMCNGKGGLPKRFHPCCGFRSHQRLAAKPSNQLFSCSNFARVGLCFSDVVCFIFLLGTTLATGGAPILCLARASTAWTAV